MSSLPAWLQSPPPVLGIDIDARRVTAVVAHADGAAARVRGHATLSLPAGAVVPSLTATNIIDRQAVVAAVRRAVETVGGRHRRCALVVPDTVARVTLLHFEHVPAQPRDLEQLVRLQLRKALPFPVEQAQLTIVPGRSDASGHEFLSTAARQAVIEEYEQVCTEAGLHAGTVDLSTLNVVNTVLLGDAGQGGSQAHGDWLLVHAGTDYSSFAIVRDEHVIFFRTRPTGAEEDLADVVHQTRMYFEDRLAGQGFTRVLLAGGADASDTLVLARELETRLGVEVQPVDVRRAAAVEPALMSAGPDALAAVAAPAGLVLRER